MAEDAFVRYDTGLESPLDNAETVVPSDATDLINTSRAIYIGQTGDLSVRMKGSTAAVTFTNLPVGLFPIRVDRVLGTGTTAGDIVALS